MGQEAIFKGRVYKPSDLVAEVDKITASEVKSVRRFHFSNGIIRLSFFFSFDSLFFQYYEIFNFTCTKVIVDIVDIIKTDHFFTFRLPENLLAENYPWLQSAIYALFRISMN